MLLVRTPLLTTLNISGRYRTDNYVMQLFKRRSTPPFTDEHVAFFVVCRRGQLLRTHFWMFIVGRDKFWNYLVGEDVSGKIALERND